MIILILKENMVYKNLLSRFVISIIILFTYLSISIYNFEYMLIFIFALYFLIILEVIINFKKNKLLIIIYVLFSLSFIFNIDFVDKNLIKFNLMIITIISFDIFSYIFGSSFGKRKILIKISPKKTLEGLLGGIFASIMFSFVYSSYYNLDIDINLLIFVFLIILSAFIGDIIQSFFKRINGLKNSSNYLPGHGGFFDRFDSFLLSIIIYSLLVSFI